MTSILSRHQREMAPNARSIRLARETNPMHNSRTGAAPSTPEGLGRRSNAVAADSAKCGMTYARLAGLAARVLEWAISECTTTARDSDKAGARQETSC